MQGSPCRCGHSALSLSAFQPECRGSGLFYEFQVTVQIAPGNRRGKVKENHVTGFA